MILLATDLDGTFLAGNNTSKHFLYRILREHKEILLVFVTGRGLESVMPLLNDPVIPRPDYVICDVGATIVNGMTLEPIQTLQSEIEQLWPGHLSIYNTLKGITGLQWQEVPQMRRCSFFFDTTTDIQSLKNATEKLHCDLLLSAEKYVDVLPKGVNKGSSLMKLVKYLNINAADILVAGDTLNDLSLYTTGYKGVVVGNAENKLLAATESLPNVFHASKEGCGGILEAFNTFEDFRKDIPEDKIKKAATTKGEKQLLIVYHRLPFETKVIEGELKKVPPQSPNGIISALLGFFSSGRIGTWIAWEETDMKNAQLNNSFVDERKYPQLQVSRIALTKKDVDLFYKVFSKEAFWPTIFAFIDKATFNHDHWQHFLKINKLFAEKTAKEAVHEATVWIHDYNLWMVPGFLRQLRPDLNIAFFHHTSFPPADIFNIIPWRGEIIGSLLQCNYIGFHIPRFVENFVDVVKSQISIRVTEEVNCTERFLTYSCPLGVEKMTREIIAGGRTIRIGAHPVGVNTENIKKLYQQSVTQDAIQSIRSSIGDKKIILSVERLDYVKGPLEKIIAFQEFLEQYPEYHGKVELINICNPPAKGMKIYEKIQQELEQAIGKINGKYSRFDWTPIHFFFRSFSFEELVAYYSVADIAWITPLRDGLNLVAKEYIATQGLKVEDCGVLLLSEFAGASVELKYALLTNPYDRKSLKEGLLQALTMELAERKMRMKRLFDSVKFFDIKYWGEEFLKEIRPAKVENETTALINY